MDYILETLSSYSSKEERKTDDRNPDTVRSNQDVEMFEGHGFTHTSKIHHWSILFQWKMLQGYHHHHHLFQALNGIPAQMILPSPHIHQSLRYNLKIDPEEEDEYSEEETHEDDPNGFPDPGGEWRDMYREMVNIPLDIIPNSMRLTMDKVYEYSEFVNQRRELNEDFLNKYHLRNDGTMEVDSLLRRFCQIAPGMYISYIHPMTGHVAMENQEATTGISELYAPWYTHPNPDDVSNMRARAPDTTLNLDITQTPIVILDPLRLYRHMVEIGIMEPYTQPYSEIRRRYRNDIHFREAFMAEMVYRFRHNIFSQDTNDEEKKKPSIWKYLMKNVKNELVPQKKCKVQFNKAYFLRVK